jgi:hypothetical protein
MNLVEIKLRHPPRWRLMKLFVEEGDGVNLRELLDNQKTLLFYGICGE